MVVQHDRNFISTFDLKGVLEIFDTNPDVMFMGLPTSSVTPGVQKDTAMCIAEPKCQ